MKIDTLVLASHNRGKLREFDDLLGPLGLTIKSAADFDLPAPPENGLSFLENALMKARFVSQQTGLPALADDSGLAVAALGGAPGIHSSRYAGVHGDDAANNRKLLEALRDLQGEKARAAAFYCALAFVRNGEDPIPVTVLSRWEGSIATEPRGSGGFGYDPLFLVKGRGLTSAQLPAQIKDLISHRARASLKLVAALRDEGIIGDRHS